MSHPPLPDKRPVVRAWAIGLVSFAVVLIVGLTVMVVVYNSVGGKGSADEGRGSGGSSDASDESAPPATEAPSETSSPVAPTPTTAEPLGVTPITSKQACQRWADGLDVWGQVTRRGYREGAVLADEISAGVSAAGETVTADTFEYIATLARRAARTYGSFAYSRAEARWDRYMLTVDKACTKEVGVDVIPGNP